jgi:hypothetical protein
VPVTNGYCSVVDLKEQIDDADFNTVPIALIERAINAVSRSVDRYCGFPRRKFWLDTNPTVRHYDARAFTDDGDGLWISDVGSKAGLTVEVDTALNGSFSTALTEHVDYALGPDGDADQTGAAFAFWKIGLINGITFPVQYGRPTVRVTGLHGWSAVPDEVNQAIVLRIASVVKRKDAPFGVAGFGEFGTAVRIRAEDPDVAAMLEPLRRYGAGGA